MVTGTLSRCWVAAALIAGVPGCAAPLPRYPSLDDEASRRIIAERLEGVRTVSSTGRVTLTDAHGQSVRLEGAVAAAPPDRLRLRAWKLGRAVFDITAVGGEVWVVSPEGATDGSLDIPDDGIAGAMRLLAPGFFRTARTDERLSTDTILVLIDPGGAAGPVTCEVDRGTLTPRRFLLRGDGAGGTVVLERYRVVDGIVWPTIWRLESDRGRVLIQLDGPEINRELPEGAFVPPRRAVRRAESPP